MCQIEGSQGSRQKALDLDPEKIAIRSILGSARYRASQSPFPGAVEWAAIKIRGQSSFLDDTAELTKGTSS